MNTYLAKTEPWKIKDDPAAKGKIISYSMHCLLTIIPEFSAINPKFHQNLSSYFESLEIAQTIEESYDLNHENLASEGLHDVLAKDGEFRRTKL